MSQTATPSAAADAAVPTAADQATQQVADEARKAEEQAGQDPSMTEAIGTVVDGVVAVVEVVSSIFE